MPRERDVRLDVLKGLAVLAVVVLHSVPRNFLFDVGAAFHIWQAVPIFLVLLGYNAASSAVRRGVHYDKTYWRQRFRRIGVPVLIAVAIDVVLALATGRGDQWGLVLIGRLPVTGPGNYFIVVVLQFVIIWPLLWRTWQRAPFACIIGLFAVDLLYAAVAEAAGGGEIIGFLERAAMSHYFGMIGLGMWLATSRDRRPIYVAAVLATAYLLAFSIKQQAGLVDHQSALAAGYAALLVIAGLRWLPEIKAFATLGRASFHIFLAQMLWFAWVVPQGEARWVVLSLVTCAVTGLAWWRLDFRASVDRPS